MYRNTLQRYAKYCTYANKNKYFIKDVMTLLMQCPRNDALISLCSNEFSNIPPKLRSLNAAHTHFFYTKIHFFLKKFAYVHFL